MPPVYVVGTCDTKGDELAYVKELIEARQVPAVLVDIATQGTDSRADIAPETVAAHHPQGSDVVLGLTDRGQAVAGMSEALAAYMAGREDVAGVIGLGGSGGTAMITPAMQALPVGLPKIMVSTVASGDVSAYVGASDIAMMPAVTDIAGLNRISRKVLANAAHALAGAVTWQPPRVTSDKPAVGLTMFGVTTPCVNQVREQLESDYDCLVFHATGTGGRAMEKLADSGLLSGFLDISTTEVCDLFMGGVMSAGSDRFGAVIRSQRPYVGAPGALDMVNFGPIDTVPERYRERNLYKHNPQVTLMRTTPEECTRMGTWIAERLNQAEGPVRFLLPEKGVSMIDAEGQPFHDPEADRCLFEALEATFVQTGQRRLERLPYHIDDPAFAQALVAHFREIAG